MTAPLVIDAHLHLYRTAEEGEQGKHGYQTWEYGPRPNVRFSTLAGDGASAREALDAAGASMAVVANLLDVVRPGVPPAEDLVAFNRWICDVSRDDSHFYPLIAVDPGLMSVQENVRHLEEMVARGARGIKLHPPLQRLDPSNPALAPLFSACVGMGLVVLSHSGPSRDSSGRGEPDSFRGLLSAFPALRIMLAHMGGAAWRQLPGIARDFPQVHFDLCEVIEWLGAPLAPTADELVSLVRQVGVGRVMMGSDFPWYDIDHTAQLVRELPGLSTEEQNAILGENAARFFDLPV